MAIALFFSSKALSSLFSFSTASLAVLIRSLVKRLLCLLKNLTEEDGLRIATDRRAEINVILFFYSAFQGDHECILRI